ncbi:hypothetical protein POPTR_017G029800v4 [Populus trichocarpa]|uniref:Uncharacterized protein n=2 Tax=Populus trichocarpa TaxID=3694 RepID=U5FL64_POPTR|nr:uncharacterized protein LOC18106918 isoform X1 [Populus trichocarpa]XP_024445071.1 uncharacterized protein LOC18106918 isoform X1 [Populus trichocarpa]XP_024445072.1 uncharacterized protein LOC18106918 isoform X1 [Populus trichocarpa]KAI5558144.1 hypothetical protein BDE02_17G020100 [Populus trichocarpa]KAI5558147.1 hypothetical protein BDE02_17G020100 [Populus trichocarpa]PNS94968.1 hypothetical protein POPTR_017G029800v4 [Populus trichocarpa]RQP01868.1 hypothetical protein POPTR_017G0298|eukprot:XP_006372874.1 uncharacterized protein LOC18106918 isoform X1 [Populus trichocarpa]
MLNKESEDGKEYFRKLSRKELQSLCKQCSLPARKSTSEMVESLAFYFMRKGLSLVSSSTSIVGVQNALLHTSSMPPLQPKPALNSIQDGFELRSCPGEEINKGNRNFKYNKSESFIGPGAYNKEIFGGLINDFREVSPSQFFSQYAGSHVNHNKPQLSLGGRVEDSPPFHGTDVNTIASSEENAQPSMKTTANVPASFEFHVSSEEGIKLCVDLNSSPSEWIKKYKNQVSLCDNVVNTKSRSLYQELGCIGESNKKMKSSVLQNMDSDQIRDDFVQTDPSPSSVAGKNINVSNGHPVGGNNSLISSPIIPCGVVVDVTQSLEADPGLASAEPSSDGQNQKTSNTESCSKKESIAAPDSDITDTTLEKTACNFAVNSISNGSVDCIALMHQSSKRDDEVCENSTQQNSCNLENASVVFPGCFMEMQLSETGNYPKDASCLPHKNGKFLDPYNSKHNRGSEQDGLANSSENNRCDNQVPACSEEQEWSNAISGRESSVCSQVDDSFGKTSLKSEILRSSEELLRKRSHVDRASQNGCGKHDTIILRSTRRSAGKVLPRRSMSEFAFYMLPASQQLD